MYFMLPLDSSRSSHTHGIPAFLYLFLFRFISIFQIPLCSYQSHASEASEKNGFTSRWFLLEAPREGPPQAPPEDPTEAKITLFGFVL